MQTLTDSTRPISTHLRATISATQRFQPLQPWIDRLSLISTEAGQITFGVSDSSLAELFTDDLSDLLAEALATDIESPATVRVVPLVPSVLSSDPVNEKMTFDAFHDGVSNRLAVAAARAVADSPGTSYNPLFIRSDIGMGKSHLLHAIRNQLTARHPELRILLLSADSFCMQLHQAVQQNQLEAFRHTLTSADALLLDDLHLLSDQSTASNELLTSFNILHSTNRQLIVTSTRKPARLEGFPPSLLSRLQWGLVVEMEMPTSSMRRHYILSRSRDCGLALSDEVVDYLAGHTFGPLRELEGLLNTLRSHASLLDEAITLSLVRKLAGAASHQPSRPVVLSDVDEFIMERFSVTFEQLTSRSRARSIAYPRQIAMFLAHTHTTASLEEIGHHFGGRDHSTVKHGCEKIRALSETDPQVRGLVAQFRRQVSRTE